MFNGAPFESFFLKLGVNPHECIVGLCEPQAGMHHSMIASSGFAVCISPDRFEKSLECHVIVNVLQALVSFSLLVICAFCTEISLHCLLGPFHVLLH